MFSFKAAAGGLFLAFICVARGGETDVVAILSAYQVNITLNQSDSNVGYWSNSTQWLTYNVDERASAYREDYYQEEKQQGLRQSFLYRFDLQKKFMIYWTGMVGGAACICQNLSGGFEGPFGIPSGAEKEADLKWTWRIPIGSDGHGICYDTTWATLRHVEAVGPNATIPSFVREYTACDMLIFDDKYYWDQVSTRADVSKFEIPELCKKVTCEEQLQ
eukprot:gene16534-19633_t